ncbi:MAG: DNA mismatch repair protein MutS [Elusimicrobiota bacterium]
MAQTDPETQTTHPSRDSLTPLMRQYRDIKDQYPGIILFFRLGDFYEMFGEDARRASEILQLVLTRRQETPMCGIPHHAANGYIKKLIAAGEKVAICEQLEEPSPGKKIVRRGVTRVITPGTLLDESLLETKKNNYLACVCPAQQLSFFGLAYTDISTGEFFSSELTLTQLKQELARINPGELLIPHSWEKHETLLAVTTALNISVSTVDDRHLFPEEALSRITSFYSVRSLKPLGLEDRSLACGAVAGILSYLQKTRCERMPALLPVRYYSLDQFLLLDQTAVKNLELVEGLSSHSRENSLLEVMDLTVTPMGSRRMRNWLTQPLLSRTAIVNRQECVSHFVTDGAARMGIRTILKDAADMERIMSRVVARAASPRDLIALKTTLAMVNRLKTAIVTSELNIGFPTPIEKLTKGLIPVHSVETALERTIIDEPPATLKDGGVIKNGFNGALDELRAISTNTKQHIAEMEAGERKNTGIGNLKIGYTSVFGYYIEVSKSNLGLVPPAYIRKQTVTGGERFITPELKVFEEKVFSADEKILRLEQELFSELLTTIAAQGATILALAAVISELDVYGALAEIAVLYHYTKPQIDESPTLAIKEGRHPVIERKLSAGTFVANDTLLNADTDQIILLTGPNMAGKSTYLRQVALIVVMAQMVSFVPAQEATIGIVDRIFTRIGAGDNLAQGESTFMVEMHETAHILNQFTPRSLIILDEVGRGTSTYDGISIAWACVEYLAAKHALPAGPKVLFATHYFELTDLETRYEGVKNYNVAVKEWNNGVIFMHKIVSGAADRSYGIHVAKLAGLPAEVIVNAGAIMRLLEEKALAVSPGTDVKNSQLNLFASFSEDFLIELNTIDIDNLTPIQGLEKLAQLQNKYKR